MIGWQPPATHRKSRMRFTPQFLEELRAKMKSPRMFANIEKLINSSKQGRDWLKYVEGQVANRREAMAKAAKAS